MNQLVYTNDRCVGCNNCINVCSATGACVSVETSEQGKFKIEVDGERCIACGACFDVCEHGAREFSDDTEEFFAALERGEQISLLIAPSFQANYPEEYGDILGALKVLGVNRMIDVAFGADIATWCYVNYIQESGFHGGISQPCPAVVNFIEKYEPELIGKLFPIHSPMICAAIYARKNLGISDKFAFISPCIAKKIEIDDPDTGGIVSYNVTFPNLVKYLEKKCISIDGFQPEKEVEVGLGRIWPMPGGLKENIHWLLGDDVLVRQVEGEKRLYQYIRRNAEKIKGDDSPFLMYDMLNCTSGCLCGTAVDLDRARTDDALLWLMNARQKVGKNAKGRAWQTDLSPSERLAALNEQFKELDPLDYRRSYTDKSGRVSVEMPPEEIIYAIFLSMHKDTEEKQNINCSSCGNETCRDMAVAIYNGFNHQNNCFYLLRDRLFEEREKLRILAEYDQAFGILNRRTILERVVSDFDLSDTYAVVLTNLNNFKGINVTYGTAGGDAVLMNIVQELKIISEEHNWLLGRYGGDEFMLVIPGRHLKYGDDALTSIVEALTVPTMFGGERIVMTASVGVSNSESGTVSYDNIVYAEKAMNYSKTSGKNTVHIYTDKQKDEVREEAVISDFVWDAIEHKGFFMVYQPKVDARTRKVCGYEALVRMKRQGIYPGQFIPIAEKNGWIWRIGRITTELTIRQLAEWRKEGFEILPVSVNFSSNQLMDEGYIDFVSERLAFYDIPAKYIEIEITEGLFLDKTAQAHELFERFQELGIRLLMDDFGTGYSSLGYLTYIPVDVIKLDKSLVDTYLVEGKENFISDVIRLMHGLNKEMLIEGVEEKWQYERLCEFGADTIQGYYFSKPLVADEAIRFVVED